MSESKPGIYQTKQGLVVSAIVLLLLSAATMMLLGLILRFIWTMFLIGWNV